MLIELINEMEEKKEVNSGKARGEIHKGESNYENLKILGRLAVIGLFITAGSYLLGWTTTGEKTPQGWAKYINQVNAQYKTEYKLHPKEESTEKRFLYRTLFFEDTTKTEKKKIGSIEKIFKAD